MSNGDSQVQPAADVGAQFPVADFREQLLP